MARRRYRKRNYRKRKTDHYEGPFAALLGLGVLVWIAGNDTLSQLPSVVTDIVLALSALVGLGILIWVALNLRRFIKMITKRQKRRSKVERDYQEALHKKSFGHLDWERFEHFAGEVFKKQGFKVEVTKAP